MSVIEEGAKKSGIVWVGGRLAWHAWHDGAIYVVTGGGEQELPGLVEAQTVQVTLRSKDNGARLVVFDADVRAVDQSAETEAVAALAKERLNGGLDLAERWAAQAQIVRLTPREP